MERHETVAFDLQGTDRFLKGLFEGSPDGHRLPDRLHLGGQGRIGPGKFLEGKPRDLQHHIVDRRLERSLGHPCDVIGDLIQGIADRELGGDLGDRESGRLRRECRTPRHAWVHLDHHELSGVRVNRKLDVRPSGIDPDLPNNADRRIPHDLILFVRQGHGGSNRNAVARVHPHRIEILDRTDDDDIVLEVPHHLELELFPADDRALDQDLTGGTGRQAPVDDHLELFPIVGDVPTGAPEGEGRPDDGRKADPLHDLHRFLSRPSRSAVGRLETDASHRPLEGFAIFSLVDRLGRGSDQLHIILGEDPLLGQCHGNVQGGLPSHGGQERIGPLPLDDLLDDLHRDRLHIGPIRQLRVGHDRGGITIDQNDSEAFFLQSLAGLGARVVELACLPNHDRTRPDQQDALDICSPRHDTSLLVTGYESLEWPQRTGRGTFPGGRCRLALRASPPSNPELSTARSSPGADDRIAWHPESKLRFG